MLFLHYDDRGTERSHELAPGTCMVGRLPTSGLVLTDPSVSRQHATVRVDNGRVFVSDAGSRFGTFVNGEQLLAVQDGALVQPGDVLTFGCETAGLPDAVLASFAQDARLRIPMRAGVRSLNLSNAVAVAVYEAWRQQGFS